MSELIEILFCHTWWSYTRDAGLSYSAAYHWFNLLEGCAWLVFAGLVLRRSLRKRPTGIEVGYAAAFFTFALSDFREAWYQQSWLIWFKLANLVVLLVLRRRVMRRFYPAARLY